MTSLTFGSRPIWRWPVFRREALQEANSLRALRQRGIAMLVTANWVAFLATAGAALAVGTAVMPILAIGLGVLLLPTRVALARRDDAAARMTVGTLAAAIPALLVFALRGHDWQMDAHMYFFVALAALTVLCDWRPLALASALIALHHLALQWAAPTWVFTGDDHLGRVVFHALAVVLQFAVLAAITTWLIRMIGAQEEAVTMSFAHAAEARAERERATAALDRAQRAAEAVDQARRDAQATDQRHARERQHELTRLAADFDRSIAGIIVTLEGATGRLEAMSCQLELLAEEVEGQAGVVGAGGADTTAEISRLALSLATLGHSIGSVAASAEQQRLLSVEGRRQGRLSVDTIARLSGGTQQIETFIDEIRGIAAKTNLLALNATIEAARAGDAGRGFVVVAHEVKGLAGDTGRASDRIIEILTDVREAIDAAAGSATALDRTIAQVADAAGTIAGDAAEQRRLSDAIERSAAVASERAAAITARIGDLTTHMASAAALSSEVRASTGGLSAGARELRASSDRFVAALRLAPGGAAGQA